MRSPMQLLQDSVEIFKKNPKLFVSIYAVLALVSFIQEAVLDKGNDPLMASIFSVLTVVVSIFVTLAILRALTNPESMTFQEAFAGSKALAWPYFLVMIMMIVAVLLGFVLLIIPGIIFYVWFVMSPLVVVFEGKKGVEALKASKAYVEGHFFDVFGRYLFLIIPAIIVSILVAVTGSILYAITGSTLLAYNLLSLAMASVVVPICIGYSYLLYLDLKNLKTQASYTTEPAPATPEANSTPTTVTIQ